MGTCPANATYNASIKTTGLVFCMDAASKAYGVTAQDMTGSHTTALENGAVFDSDDYGSIDFDGTDDYLSTNLNKSSFSATNTELTLDVWVNPDSANSSHGILCMLASGDSEYIELRLDGLKYLFLTRYNALVRTTTYPVAINGQWTNLTCVKSPGFIAIYLNGVLDTTAAPSSSSDDLTFGDESVTIGSRGSSENPSANYWNGQISVVRVYNQAMSAQEVSQNYKATAWRYA